MAEPVGAFARDDAEAHVAVAVVSADTRAELRRCLHSLEADSREGRAEVWVVDNASSDGSPEMVAREFPWVHLIRSAQNLGYGRAVNLVAANTNARWLVASNSDVEVTEGALATLLATGEASPRRGAVCPLLVLPDGSSQHSAFPFPTVGFTLAFNAGLQRLSRGFGSRLCLEGYWDAGRRRRVPWAIAAFLLIRREAFDAVGRFDERQWIYAEDLDLGWRLARAGWHTMHEPGAVVRHEGSAATGRAFGEERTARWMAATYAWLARRRGLVVAGIVATINVLGAGGRAVGFRALAAIWPARWEYAAHTHLRWARLHRDGFRQRFLSAPR